MKTQAGVCVPICTPFDETGERVEAGLLRDHIDAMIDAGVHIILACGGTGEFAYLSPAERKHIAEITAKHVDGRAGFMVHTSGISTTETIEYTKHAHDLGADGCMILPPYFEGPDMPGVIDHYEAIANAVNTHIMAYNIPQSSGIDITPNDFKKLLEIDNVKSIKDSTADIVRVQQLLTTGGDVFNGGDPTTFQALVAGCPGCVWGGANVMPKEAVNLYNLVQQKKLVEANELWQRMLPAQIYFWTHIYNPSVKTATNLAGRPVGPCRKPQRALNDNEMEELKTALRPMEI